MAPLSFFITKTEDSDPHASVPVNAGGRLADEDIEVLEFHFDKAMAMIASGEIREAKTIMLLYHAHVHKFF